MSTADAVEKPLRKFPPPCWTQDETLILIDAYRERWYALRRGYLRTAEWEAVAAEVARRCPDSSPAKTSAQCRHKMEKLRQRYRAEKQRALNYPGSRFFSSWFFFENMDAMETGASPTVRSNQAGDQGDTFNDRSLLTVGVSLKNSKQMDEISDIKVGCFDRNLMIPLHLKTKIRSKNDKILNGYSSYLVNGLDEEAVNGVDFGSGFRHVDGDLMHSGLRAKKLANIFGNSKSKFIENGDAGDDIGVAFSAKARIVQYSTPAAAGNRSRKVGKIDGKLKPIFDCGNGEEDGVCMKQPGDRNSAPAGYDTKNLNGFAVASTSALGNKHGEKRKRDPIKEMVSSIKFLGEGFVKMEKMKLDMAREIEKMRMQAEIKRNELILESQRQIVDAFVKGLLEIKNKKVKNSFRTAEEL